MIKTVAAIVIYAAIMVPYGLFLRWAFTSFSPWLVVPLLFPVVGVAGYLAEKHLGDNTHSAREWVAGVALLVCFMFVMFAGFELLGNWGVIPVIVASYFGIRFVLSRENQTRGPYNLRRGWPS